MSAPVVTFDIAKPLLSQLRQLGFLFDQITDRERLIFLAGLLRGWTLRVESRLRSMGWSPPAWTDESAQRAMRGAWHLCQSQLACESAVTPDLIREVSDALEREITWDGGTPPRRPA